MGRYWTRQPAEGEEIRGAICDVIVNETNKMLLVPPHLSLYFAYGSNLCLAQMTQRCGDGAEFLGVAHLPDYRWHINERGCANILPLSNASNDSANHGVYGALYTMTDEAVAKMDVHEGVAKQIYERVPIRVKPLQDDATTEMIDAFAYIDKRNVRDGPPREEYVGRMNAAISDGLDHGIPSKYVTEVLRPFIPPPS